MDEKKLYQGKPGWLDRAVEASVNAGAEVFGPVEDEGLVNLAPVTPGTAMTFGYQNVHLPLKALFLPRSEVLFAFEKEGDGDVAMQPTPEPVNERLILGCRPCDATGLEVLDKVFGWDYDEMQYRSRRDHTTVVSWACSTAGPRCFCVSVGGSPHNEAGSDVLVFPVEGDAGALLKVLSERGAQFIERLGDSVSPAPGDTPLPGPPELSEAFDTEKVKLWLDENFESEFWTDVALRCLGCGVCSFLCPTCHCFDIVDECSWNCGERRRNWDCCSFALFTKHASGHNPRGNQTMRCRQRVMHKFKYFPDRFEKVACVGCGRCMTNCGVGQNLVSILAKIQAQ